MAVARRLVVAYVLERPRVALDDELLLRVVARSIADETGEGLDQRPAGGDIVRIDRPRQAMLPDGSYGVGVAVLAEHDHAVIRAVIDLLAV